ncbi:MAG: hypothetical protein AB7G80_03465 [Dongiaceae bacterium]
MINVEAIRLARFHRLRRCAEEILQERIREGGPDAGLATVMLQRLQTLRVVPSAAIAYQRLREFTRQA